jgi:hypothetical protein
VVLYAGIFVLRQEVSDPSEIITALYVLPIALLCVTFGLRGGVVGAVVGVALLAFWVVSEDPGFTASEWITRIIPLVAMGLLLGHAWDQLRRAAEVRRERELALVRHRQAVEINDTLIQGMAAAKWALEVGQLESAAATLDQTIRLGQQLVSGLIRDADMGPARSPASKS